MRRLCGAAPVVAVLLLTAACASSQVADAPDHERDPSAQRPLLYVANQDAASVSVVDAEAGEVTATVDLRELGFSATARPHHTAVEPDGSHWYVSLIGDGWVLKFNWENRLAGRARFETPGLLALDPGSDRLFVGRSMAAVNPPARIGILRRTDMSLEEVDVFLPRPHAMALTPDGAYLYTASLAENRMASLEVESGRLELVELEGPQHTLVQFAASPDGRWLVGTGEMSGRLLVFELTDPARPVLAHTLELGGAPWHPAFTPDGRRVYVGRRDADAVAVVEARDWTLEATVEGRGLAQPHGAAVAPDGRHVFVSSRNLGGTYVPEGRGGEGTAREGTAGHPGTVVVIDTETHEIVRVLEVGAYAAGMSGPAAAPPRR